MPQVYGNLSLQPEKSVYTLNAMPVEIIGYAYEQFLGDTIVHKGRGIAAEPKPEVRKAGGVYYTPKYIVDYIVQNTVCEKLKKCKSPKGVEKIKIVEAQKVLDKDHYGLMIV